MPERDEEIGTCPHAFPAQERDQKVFAQHQHQHGEHEQVQVHEELGELWIAVHVTNGVQVNKRADSGDEQSHGDAEWINKPCHVDL